VKASSLKSLAVSACITRRRVRASWLRCLRWNMSAEASGCFSTFYDTGRQEHYGTM